MLTNLGLDLTSPTKQQPNQKMILVVMQRGRPTTQEKGEKKVKASRQESMGFTIFYCKQVAKAWASYYNIGEQVQEQV